MSLHLVPSRSVFRGHQKQRRNNATGLVRIDFVKRRPWLRRTAKRAAADDGVAINGKMEMPRAKLDHALMGEDLSSGLVQVLHDAARSIELAVLEHSSSAETRATWFSAAWLGIDRNAWVKGFAYQAAVYSFLQAAIEISSRGERRDRDVNIFVQRSLMRLCSPLENLIRDELSSKQPAAFDWFWSQQHPMVVTSFVNILENDSRFTAATTESWKGVMSISGSASDLSLLMFALSCIAAITKLGSAKISCTQFLSLVPDITGRLMDLLVDFVPMRQAYFSVKDIGLRREFLLHFGSRASSCRVNNEKDIEEIGFWVDLVQMQLQQAIDRERIWSRLTTCESIEILEKDLAIFGFFIALGRSTQLFLSANGYTATNNDIQNLIRHLIGGSVLYYPQLSSISSYQLYVEVVCEELEWLPFYGVKLSASKFHHENKSQGQELPYDEVASRILDVCSHWTTSFIKYSPWLENPSNIKAARFLSKCHMKLKDCRQELGLARGEVWESISERKVEKIRSIPSSYSATVNDIGTFDKAMESVEEAINRLEGLLQELHLSSSNTGKENLKAACSDLERIRKLKKEAEFLEASFRAKAASLEEGNKLSVSRQSQSAKGKEDDEINDSTGKSNPRGLWGFFARTPSRKFEPEFSMAYQTEDVSPQKNSTFVNIEDLETNEIRRFEVLRTELIELENRVKRSTDESFIEDTDTSDNRDDLSLSPEYQKLVKAPKEDNFIAKSIDKLKETTTDVFQGTQLLAIDAAAAMILIKRSLTGDELAEKEKKALQRTLTDLASVVPIGILMLLPVTAVGHAAMLAAIQRYVPALIPSTYAPERLDLLRQLEKVKEMESNEIKNDEDDSQRA